MGLRGVVLKWSPEQGFGLIEGEDGSRYWAHFVHIVTGTGFAELPVGQRVKFTADGSRQEGYLQAKNVAVEGQAPRDLEAPNSR